MRIHSRVPRYTAFDYTLIAINPALIVLMVSALLHFLAYVFYQGEFQTRLIWILLFFTIGAVGVSRIAIEQGHSYAAGYAMPLAVVTWLAIKKYVEFSGAWASFSGLLNALLIAVAWFLSYKLTRDCTVLEDERTGDGRGLLETAGLESGRQASQAVVEEPSQPSLDTVNSVEDDYLIEVAGQGETSSQEGEPQRRLHRKPHPHGVWVIYFSLVALPLFGLGQAALATAAARTYALALFCRYLACAMGLLATTSLLGMRRYLRRRNLRMPTEMTVIWLTTGAAIVGGVMVVSLLLPRPSPEVGLRNVLPVAAAPESLKPNRWGFFGGIRSQSDSSRPTGHDDRQDQEAQSQSDSAPRSAQRRQVSDQNQFSPPAHAREQSNASSSSRQPASTDGSKQTHSLDGSPRSQAVGRGDRSEKSNAVRSVAPRGNEVGQPQPGAPPDQSPESSGSDAAGKRQVAQPTENGSAGRSLPKSRGSGHQDSRASRSEQAGSPSSPPDGTEASSQTAGMTEAKRDTAAGTAPERSSLPSQGTGATQTGRNTSGWNLRLHHFSLPAQIGSILYWAYWLIVLIAAFYVLWRCRAYVWQYLQHLHRQWRWLLEWWFGRAESQDALMGAVEAAEPRPRFRQLANPFATDFSRMTPADLVRQSFYALEVWAADMGIARSPDDTPLEFSASVVSRFPELGQGVSRLCQWYCCLAYGDRRIPGEAAAELRELWLKMSRLYHAQRD